MVNPLTNEQQRKSWTISKSLSGVTYYYNRATKKSQYQMPDCFKTTQQKLEHPQWKQYRTAQGKKFYYNAKTTKSVWTLPNEVKEWRIKMQQQQRIEQQNQRRKQQEGTLDLSEQHKKKIKQLMKQKYINASHKWDDCKYICRDDPRWDLITQMQEKKTIFNEYIGELKKTEDKQKKVKLDILKANFLQMLMASQHLTSDSKMHKVTILFAGDQRWKELEEEQRNNVFQSYMDELYNKEKELAKQKKKFYMDELGKQMQAKKIHHRMRWEDFKYEFIDSTNYKNLIPIDRLNKFVEYILDAQKKYDQQVQNQKMNQQRTNRQNFRQLLISKMKQGKIDHKTRWPSFVRSNAHEKILLQMMDPDQRGSSAHQLFEDLMEGIRQNHKGFKVSIKSYFKTIGFKINIETSQQQFQDKLKNLEQFWKLRPIIRDYFFFYFKNKIKGKGSKKEKKDKKIILKLFKSMKQIKPRCSYYEVSSKLKSQLKQHNIPEDIIRKQFDKYLQQLQGKKGKRRSDSQSNSSEDDKRKKRKREKSLSRSQSNSSEDSRKASKKNKKQKRWSRSEKKTQQKHHNDNQQEGQIRDSDDEGKHKKKSNKSKHKKRKHSSSSDSD